MTNATCTRRGCPKPIHCKGLCKKHYMEARAERLKLIPCVTDGCGWPSNTLASLCSRCDWRRRTYGSPLAGPPMRKRRGTGPPRDQVRPKSPKYARRHRAIRRARGAAWRQACEHCGGKADDWATIHGREGDQPDDYMPLCKSCHNRYDGKVFMLPRLVGEDRPQAKLTNQQAREIWARRDDDGMSRSALAREYGTSYRTVWMIQTGRGWREVVSE